MSNSDVNASHLTAFIERIERLEVERKERAEDINEVFAEAKGSGYDVKIMRKIVRLRAMDPDKRAEEVAILELYASALGLQGVLPL
ncbi:Azospirillum phage Cd, Gp10 [uncultured Caudovirales phage]|uniref:Azospirillum phage Cd, Gp10 n=1 Tax=uncultured Caudovirales phage TaxID=2100421 RepID=A0A6J5R6L5_9CAUD|nr:Azospirillum phage Cd, Gp10 [uncultured Caudovirales phage]CAB4176656.1 Azospirillum phage Cd, Gp10 [uncultured Caudovirales phage]CAB4190286.1 Azospirillum phage Cd, Gp10 [uncultured Caudovirales phage]